MSSSSDFDFDEIGYWSEIKLEIVRKYAKAYSTILSRQRLEHVYVDGFAGAGVHVARSTGEFVAGSPLNALLIDPPFKEFFLIDMDAGKAEHLRELTRDRANVHITKETATRSSWKRFSRRYAIKTIAADSVCSIPTDYTWIGKSSKPLAK